MNSTKRWMTAQIPSRFVMPISGHAFGMTAPATDARCTATALVVRERRVAAGTQGAVKPEAGLAQSYFPGTTAWSPPTC